MKIPSEAFAEILHELESRPLQVNEYRNRAGKGRSQTFGIVGKRSQPPDYSRQCWLRPKLYKLLLDFGDKYVKGMLGSFTSITVNQNYKADPHYDKNNVGNSFLVAFGDFEGGELELHEGERKGLYNIRHTPIIDNFSTVLHSVRDYTGNRYSIVFYTYMTNTTFPEPSVREEGGKYWFYRGEERCTGLPHPLRGRKIK